MTNTDSPRVDIDTRAVDMQFLDIEGVRQESVAILFGNQWVAPVVLVREDVGDLVSSARLFSLEEMLIEYNDWAEEDGIDGDGLVEVDQSGEWDTICIEGVVKSSVAIDHYEENERPRICIHTEHPEEPDHIIELPEPVRSEVEA